MRMLKGDALDPKGLIAEGYKIEGITLPECRTIFLDWALSYSGDNRAGIEALLARHGTPGHPMTEVLTEGLATPERPKRRGGWRSRSRS